jgi:serine phosphatase RsbU (regulator of sigma subunit)/putative methionine-R-sulfoxide reductase with GAF domain
MSQGLDLQVLLHALFPLALLGLMRLMPWRRRKAPSDSDDPVLASLAEMSETIASVSSDPSDLAEIAFQEATRLMDTDFFQLGVIETDALRMLIQMRDGKRQEEQHIELLPASDGIVGWVQKHGRPLLVEDFENSEFEIPECVNCLPDDRPRSGLFVPLKVSEQIIGLIGVQSRQTSSYHHGHQRLLSFLAGNVAAALGMITLHTEIRFRTSRLTTLGEISRRLISLRPLPALLQEIAVLISQAFESCAVGIYELDGDHVLLRASAPEAFSPEVRRIPEGQGIIGRTALDGRAYVIKNGASDEESPLHGFIEGATELAIPLRLEDRVLGVLFICTPEGRPFALDHMQLAEMLAAQLALAMLESHNYAQRQEESWITTMLLEVARHASQPGDVNQALQSVLQLSTMVAGTSWIMLLVKDETGEGLRIGPIAGLRRKQLLGISEFRIHPASLGIAPPYSEYNMPVAIKLPPFLSAALGTEDASSMALSDGQTLLGALLLESTQLTERQNSLMAGIANQISLRIENARLIDEIAARRSLEREITMARNIQQSFLPKFVPIHPGWEIGVTWQTARDVGGDFYDFIPLPPGPHGPRLGIVIADVAGKGVPAALFMAMCRTLLRSVAISRIDPGETLERLNQILFEDTEADLFISLFYALWEPEAGRLSFANAGHNPPLLFIPEHPARIIGEHGMVLNVDEDANYQTYSLDCSPNQMLVLYTDGVTEAMNSNGELFELHRLEHMVLGMRKWKAQQVADLIADRVRQFTAEPDLSDDLTAIVIRRTSAE